MTRILLVRHGQSVWNAEGRWQGQADIELSDLGRSQARAAAGSLGSFDLIAASTLSRAAETAHIISTKLGIGPVIPIPALIERSAGEWSGLNRIEIDEQYPGYLEADKRPPGYEDDDALWARVKVGLAEVTEMLGPDDEALVVAHGGIIYMLEERQGGSRGRISNLGALWLNVDSSGEITIGERVDLVSDASLASAQASDIL